jgi:dTDP-4-dehydrorhamnose reductase
MRVWVTGGTGFVGSNVVHVAVGRGDDVLTTVHTYRAAGDLPYLVEPVEMTDAAAVRRSIGAFAPDIVVHCAILNDWDRMYADRPFAWDAYVEATRVTAEAAADAGASYVLVSTDWVFDGTQGGADESTPPNPVNLYGFLKAASELVALDRGGAVARVSGVNGLHRARPGTPRAQDPGFGYFVASAVDALRGGAPFTVWESDSINMVATPSLATECAELILRIGERRLGGIFHTCGGEPARRMELARLACDVFDLDPGLLRSGPPPAEAMPAGGSVPYDTSIVMPRTSELLDHTPSPLRDLLERFRREYDAAA